MVKLAPEFDSGQERRIEDQGMPNRSGCSRCGFRENGTAVPPDRRRASMRVSMHRLDHRTRGGVFRRVAGDVVTNSERRRSRRAQLRDCSWSQDGAAAAARPALRSGVKFRQALACGPFLEEFFRGAFGAKPMLRGTHILQGPPA